MSVELSTDLWIYILNRRELDGFKGFLRPVCRLWRDILDKPEDRKTLKEEMNKRIEFFEFGVKHLEHHEIRTTYEATWADLAAFFGRIDLIEHLQEKRIPGQNLEIFAANGGQRHVLLWLSPTLTFTYKTRENIMANAAVGGHLDMIKWLLTFDGYSCGKMTATRAAQGGHLHILEWLRDPTTGDGICPWSHFTCSYAALQGHLHILEWLRDPTVHGEGVGICPWSSQTCAYALEDGHFEILKWLRDPTTGGGVCPWDQKTCEYAAAGGYIHILEWLRDPAVHGVGVCPWDEDSCSNAAACGEFETLKWLRDPTTGGGVCPWNDDVTMLARQNGETEILEWALENGCPSTED